MATYPTTPQPLASWTKGVQYKVLVSESEDGYEQRRETWPNPKRQYQLQYVNLTYDEMIIIKNFYDNQHGPLTAFTYYDSLYSLNVTCRFVDDTLQVVRTGFNTYNIQVNLLQVF